MLEKPEDPRDLTEDMEEPVHCPGCGMWVELQWTRPCRICRELLCRDCLTEGICANCEPEQE